MDPLRVCDNRYIKTKIKIYDNKVYTDFHGLDDEQMWIFYSYFYWLITCLQKQILPARILRQLYI